MNPTIITIIIATAAFILTIVGTIRQISRDADRRFDDFKLYLDAKFETVNNRITNLDTRMARIERQQDAFIDKLVLPGGKP